MRRCVFKPLKFFDFSMVLSCFFVNSANVFAPLFCINMLPVLIIILLEIISLLARCCRLGLLFFGSNLFGFFFFALFLEKNPIWVYNVINRVGGDFFEV